MPSWRRRLPYMNTVSSKSARRSQGCMLRVKRPSWMRVNSSSSSTMPVRRLASREMMTRPLLVSSSFMRSVPSRVSLQPEMAVSGVRSSWETEEMNSLCIFSVRAIWVDISLMVWASSPISSSYLVLIWAP